MISMQTQPLAQANGAVYNTYKQRLQSSDFLKLTSEKVYSKIMDVSRPRSSEIQPL